MAIGPLMLDLAGLDIQSHEQEILSHPQVGGVILFARNYESPQQVQQLIASIRAIRPELIIAVDQEGGRVQRFRSGVSRLPPLRNLGEIYQQDKALALELAETSGWLMAAEMLSLGVDISFAPVLDLDYGRSEVIGDRAFGSDAATVIALATAYIKGMNSAGMAATGKHFPGHGWVAADSHLELPVDERSLADLAEDMAPFQQLATSLRGIMPAHVIYAQHCASPAGFSEFWLQHQLRSRLGFEGVIFSDDLTMEGAACVGDYPERAAAAFAAGCDMVLVCNKPEGALAVLSWLEGAEVATRQKRLSALAGKPMITWPELQDDPRWHRARNLLKIQ